LPTQQGQLRIRITQLDGVIPNLALMKLAAFHKARGDLVHFSRSPYCSPTEPTYDRLYRSGGQASCKASCRLVVVAD
jgi:hypothetical protein